MSDEYRQLLSDLKKLHQQEAGAEARLEKIRAKIMAINLQLKALHLEGDNEFNGRKK